MTTILDIGCGIRPQRIHQGQTVALEPHHEYRAWLAQNRPDVVIVSGEWADAPSLFSPLSFDHVTIMDVIEHLEKDDAVKLLQHALTLARKSVTVYTPLGFFEQEPVGVDAWGMHGCEWQRHRSGWTQDDFDGWEIRIHERTGKPTMMMAVWTR